jgi:hypothetical protein
VCLNQATIESFLTQRSFIEITNVTYVNLEWLYSGKGLDEIDGTNLRDGLCMSQREQTSRHMTWKPRQAAGATLIDHMGILTLGEI